MVLTLALHFWVGYKIIMTTIRPELNRVWASADETLRSDPGDEKYKKGWVAEIPTYEVLNYLQWKLDTTLLALGERGIFEWGPDISYAAGALAWDEVDGKIYIAKVVNPSTELSPSSNSEEWEASSAQISRTQFDEVSHEINDHVDSKGGTNPHELTPHDVDTYSCAEIDAMVADSDGAEAAHILDTDNPHDTTAAQAGAVPVEGGTYEGPVTMGAGVLNLDAEGAGTVSSGTSGIVLGVGGSGIGVTSDGKAAVVNAGVFTPMGTAATHDVQPDSSTTTPGTVPLNGGDIFVTRVLYNAVSGDPSLAIGTYVVSNTDPETGESINAVVTHSHTDTHMGEVRENGVRVYSPSNKPTPADIGALPVIGGQITGDLDVTGTQDAGYYTLNGNYLAGTLQVTLPACTDFNAAPLGYSSVGGSVLNGPTATIYGTLLTLRSTGTDNLPSVAAPVNGVWYQQMLFTTDGIVYSRAQTNASPWTAWALQYSSQNIPPISGVQNTALGAQGSLSASSGTTEAPAGCVLTGGGDFGADNGSYYYRPLMVTYDGTNWVTVGLLGLPSPVLKADFERLIFEPYSLADVGNVLSRFTLSDSAVIGVHALVNEDGLEWYRARNNLVGNHFIAYHDDTGVIEQITDNVQMLWPVGMAVAALDMLPNYCSIDGAWIYADGVVQQSSEIVTSRTLDTNKKIFSRELIWASSYAFMLQSCINEEIEQPSDEDSIIELEKYVSTLRSVDLTQSQPSWPARPEV